MIDYLQKHSLYVLLILMGLSTACSPTKPITMMEVEAPVAIESVTEKEIPSVVYQFSSRIHDSYLDTVSGNITLQFRDYRGNGDRLKKSGRIAILDPDSSKLRWDYPLSYNRFSYMQHGSTLIEYSGNNGHFIDLETGRREERIRHHIYFIDPDFNVGMGYRISSARKSKILFGVNMEDGEEIWDRPIDREYDWNDIIFPNDTTMVLVADGIHTIDPRDGTGWSYSSKTGKKDYTAAVVGTIAGIATGMLTGHYAVSTAHTMYSNMVSNVLIGDKNSITLATAEELVRLDGDGNTLWSYPLLKEEASQSFIWEESGIVYMLNTGYASNGYFNVPIGKSYIAGYDNENGKEVYKTYIESEKNDFIRDFKHSGNKIITVFANHLEQYNYTSGEFLMSKDTELHEAGDLAVFIGYQAFRKDGENVYYSITGHDETNHYIATTDMQILVLNRELEFVENIDAEELYLLKTGGEDFAVISDYNETHSLLLDEGMMPVAEIDAAGEFYINESSLYVLDDKKLVKVQLPEYW